jgi:hypothetical protein
MAAKGSSGPVSHRSFDSGYERPLARLRAAVAAARGCSEGGAREPELLDRLSRFIDSVDDILGVLDRMHIEQRRMVESLEALVYRLEGRLQTIELSIDGGQREKDRRVLRVLNGWIAAIERHEHGGESDR